MALKQYIIQALTIFIIGCTVSCNSDANTALANQGKIPSENKYRRDYSALPIQPARTLNFNTTEATQMHVDVSPDGQRILFTILGDIYMIPEAGGKAIQLTRGLAINTRPLWSPDGKYFAYISDATGSPQTHIRDIEGSVHKILPDAPPKTQFSNTSTVDPEHNYYDWPSTWAFTWLPNSNAILSGASIFNVSGKKQAVPSFLMDDYSKDNKIIGYSSDHNKIYSFNKLNNSQIEISIFDSSGNTTLQKILFKKYEGERIGNFTLSRDAKYLAFCRTAEHDVTTISVMNLSNQTVTDAVQFNSFHFNDLGDPEFYLHYSFTPDNRFIYLAYEGKIHKVSIDGSENTIVPFSADVAFDMGPLKMNKFPVNFDTKKILVVRNAILSADGNKLVFSALEKIYSKDISSGKIAIVSDGPGVFNQAHFSPDSKLIVYAGNDKSESGKLYLIETAKIGNKPRLIHESGTKIKDLAWSPDGKMLAILAESKKEPHLDELSILFLETGKIKVMRDKLANSKIIFSDNAHLIYTNNLVEKLTNSYLLVIATGKESKIFVIDHPGLKTNDLQFSMSPDLKFLTFNYSNDLFLVPVQDLKGLYGNNNKEKIIRFACNGVDMHWEQNGKLLSWNYGNNYFSISPEKILQSIDQSQPIEDKYKAVPFDFVASKVLPDTSIHIDLSYEPLHQKGIQAFTNANIVTMKNRNVIKNGTIIIRDGRIAQIGNSQDISIPAYAQRIDMKGKTIIPGMFDLHCHVQRDRDIDFEEEPELKTYFAYGVTTALDPSSSFDMAAYMQILEAGVARGPRFYSVGRSVGPAYNTAIANIACAEKEVKERKELGSIVIKQYKQKTREQQQWLEIACDKAGLNMTNEAGYNFLENLTMIKNGSPKVEHFEFAGWGAYYKDVKYMLANCKTIYTLTSTAYLQDYYRKVYPERTQKLKNINSKEYESAIKEHYTISDVPEPDNTRRAETDVKNLYSDSTVFAVGSHGDEPGAGIKYHYELWSKSIFGGIDNYDILRMATINGAIGLGIEKDLGTLEVGKIADMVILNSDPIVDIKNTVDIKYIIKNGIIYDGQTLHIVQ